jgi:hypothetical protein
MRKTLSITFLLSLLLVCTGHLVLSEDKNAEKTSINTKIFDSENSIGDETGYIDNTYLKKDLRINSEWAEFLGVSHQSAGVSTIVNGRAFTSKGIVTRVRDTYFGDGGITIKTKDSYYGPHSYTTKVGDNYFTSRSCFSDKTADRDSKSGITTVDKDTYYGTSVYQTKTRDGYFYGSEVR